MFDSYSFGRVLTEYLPYEKSVKEIRAPTDDSIKLYEEIKQKAYNSILETIQINDNTFNVKAEVFKDMASHALICRYTFTLNGKRFDGKIIDNNMLTKYEWMKKIYEDASKQIAMLLMNVIT